MKKKELKERIEQLEDHKAVLNKLLIDAADEIIKLKRKLSGVKS